MLVNYSQEWAESFSRERALLLRALEPWLAADVEHVGSTSVPGMSAKPVIDMLAGVSDLTEARRAAGPLLELEYHYRPHRPEAHLFDKPHVGDWRGQTHHLHLTEPGSDLCVSGSRFATPYVRTPRWSLSTTTGRSSTSSTRLRARTRPARGRLSCASWLRETLPSSLTSTVWSLRSTATAASSSAAAAARERSRRASELAHRCKDVGLADESGSSLTRKQLET